MKLFGRKPKLTPEHVQNPAQLQAHLGALISLFEAEITAMERSLGHASAEVCPATG